MILYREILGGITDSIYVKPRASYRITTGFTAFASVIYSRAIYAESTPSADGTITADNNLGLEINGGARYETEDGFYAQLQYGVLFPLGGFSSFDTTTTAPKSADTAQALRGV
ncbi:MAG: TIGR04551 family protein, partial [Archangium sp.]|nr:TIGR04551 family protein [Archangium sp.]